VAWLGREPGGDVRHWSAGDLAAGPASGSYPVRGMVVVPASTAAVAGIALGLSKDLLQRAADVTLKERRPLVVVPRETPYTRATLEHLLALAQFVAPVGAWIAVTDSASWAATALGIAVGTWIGGFDLIYSCQDAEIDRRIGSRSFPARFGIPAALRASAVVHVGTFASFAWFGAAAGLGWLWVTGLVLTGAVLVYEHAIVRPADLSRVNRAFFTANGVIGIGLFGFALADLAVHGLGA
jgi:hypothetical protein